ncbi:hypothetical protein MMC14_002562 [Varicellaria rhodocarpa]|nr:hypothetical protein [Varicellaria rhodocarpa]
MSSFYDSKCTEPANTIQIFPAAQQTDGFSNAQYYGGAYGSRSAQFSDIGDLQVWYIQSATNGLNGDAPNENTMNPKAGQCVGYEDGVYVAGS